MKPGSSKAGVVLKMAFGAAIFATMVGSGKLNLAQVARTLTQWPVMLAITALSYGQVAIASARWRLLLRAQDVSLKFGQVWGLTMIGMLFNIVIPGAELKT